MWYHEMTVKSLTFVFWYHIYHVYGLGGVYI